MVDLKTGKNLSRRDLLKYASITIGCGVAGSVFGGDKYWMPRDNWVDTQGRSAGSIGGLQRGLGARVGMMSGGGWKNPYVTDGLVANWFGEDAGDNEWLSRIGGYRIYGDTIPTDGVNAIADHKVYQVDNVPISSNFTIEIVINGPSDIVISSGANVCFLINGNGFRFQYDNSSRDIWAEIGGVGYLPEYSKVLYNNGNRSTYTITSSGIKYVNSLTSQLGNPWNFGLQTLFGSANYKYNVGNIRVYNRILNQSQIAHNHNADREIYGF